MMDDMAQNLPNIQNLYLDERNPSYLHLVTSAQKESTTYHVICKELTDLTGHPLDSAKSEIDFEGTGLPDTTRPFIVKSNPPDSSTGIALDTPIEIIFSETMNRNSVESTFALLDTNKNNVTGEFSWSNNTHMIFKCDSLLKSLMKYHFLVNPDSATDEFANSLNDTLLQREFTTLNQDTLSEIPGTIQDADLKAQGPFYISAREITKSGADYQTSIPASGPYKFEHILPGTYQIEVFRDSDNNGRYSYGEVIPFQPAERFIIYPDSIHVRSRWPNEGNDFIFPK